MKFKIESGVEIPSGYGHSYPFVKMFVGDSFVCGDCANDGEITSSAANQYGSFHGKSFVTLRTSPGIWRCWRVS